MLCSRNSRITRYGELSILCPELGKCLTSVPSTFEISEDCVFDRIRREVFPVSAIAAVTFEGKVPNVNSLEGKKLELSLDCYRGNGALVKFYAPSASIVGITLSVGDIVELSVQFKLSILEGMERGFSLLPEEEAAEVTASLRN